MEGTPGSIDQPEKAKEQIVDHISSSGVTKLSDLKEVTGLDIPVLFDLTNELVAKNVLIRVSKFRFHTPQPEGDTEESNSSDAMTGNKDATSDSTQSPQSVETAASGSKSSSDTQSGQQRKQQQLSGDEQQSVADLYHQASTKEKAWGAVLIAVALPIVGIAAMSLYAVYAGGFLGILSIRDAIILGVILAVIGGIGLIQGIRAYRGMRS